MHFKGKGGGGCNEKTPISQIGLKGGGPQKFKLQKCIKCRIVPLQACWWSDCAFPLRRLGRQQWAWRFLTFPSSDAPGPEGSAAPLRVSRAAGGDRRPGLGPCAALCPPPLAAGDDARGPRGGGRRRRHREANQAKRPLLRRPPASSRDRRDTQEPVLGVGVGCLSTSTPRHRPGLRDCEKRRVTSCGGGGGSPDYCWPSRGGKDM